MAQKFKDTLEQLFAQAIDRNLSVTANAGSGKTRVLVERYIRILLNDPKADVTSVTAITFTKKAAAEMLVKINKRLDEMTAEAQRQTDREKLLRLRERMSYAKITTIHGFCNSILKDYPVEAGIAPGSGEISMPDLLELKKSAVLTVIEDALENPDDNVKGLFARLSRRKIETIIGLFLSKRGSAKKFSETDPRVLNDEITRRMAELIRPLAGNIIELFQPVLSRAENADSSENISTAKDALKLLSSIKGNLDTFEDMKALIDVMGTLISSLITGTGTFRVALKKFFSDSDIDLLTSGADCYAKTNKTASFLAGHRLMLTSLIDSQTAARLALRAEELIAAEKLSRSVIDFDDMLYTAEYVLRNDEVLRKVRSKITHILVDEFQDTDNVQYDIIKLLVPEIDPLSNERSGINLFIVGDGKQSIYSFRNADVRVFERARRDVKECNRNLLLSGELPESIDTPQGTIKPDNDAISAGEMSLGATFRMQPLIAAFVNALCAPVMRSEISEFDIDYSPLTAARNSSDLQGIAEPVDLSAGDIFRGRVDYLITTKKSARTADPDEESSDDEASEAVTIAEFIKKAVNNPDHVISDDRGMTRSIDYGDIAIIGRTKKPLALIVKKLDEYGLPYVLHSGGGFFAAKEIIDLVSYINHLRNPKDDLHTASLLRSPFFSVSDSLLLDISLVEGDSLSDKLTVYAARNSANPAAYHALRAESLLGKMREMLGGFSVSDTVITMLETTGYYGAVRGTKSSATIKANHEKFIEMARDFEAGGFRNLFDFAAEINFLSEEASAEPEAAVITGENAVNLMTIHSSKGLEFPVVIFANAAGKPKNQDSVYYDEDFGAVFKASDYAEDLYPIEVPLPVGYIAGLKAATADTAENKRLMYVAATRAKDYLVISSCLTQNTNSWSKPTGFAKYFFDAAGLSAEDAVSRSEANFESAVLPVLDGEKSIDVKVKFKVGLIVNPAGEDLSAGTLCPDFVERELVQTALRGDTRNEIFSASKIMSRNASPIDYAMHYVFGLPDTIESGTIGRDDIETHPEKITSSLAGTLLHSALEDLPTWFDPKGNASKKLIAESVDKAFTANNIAPDLLIRERIISECGNICETKLVHSRIANLKTSLSEKEMFMPVGDNFLMAKIDLLLFDDDGIPEIWDWKSNRAFNRGDIIPLAEKYRYQTAVYALFVLKRYPKAESVRAGLLFSRLAAPGAEDDDWTFFFEYTREEIQTFEAEIIENAERMKAVNYFESDEFLRV